MVIKRANQLKVMVSDEELVMLRELADRDGVSVADLVRQLVRAAHQHAEADVNRVVAKAKRMADNPVVSRGMQAIGNRDPLVARAIKGTALSKKKK